MMRRAALAVIMFMTVIPGVGCAQEATEYRVERAFPELTFRKPVDLQSPHDGSRRLFVVEQDGVIREFQADERTNTSRVFLDIRDRVDTAGNEMGLLGLALQLGAGGGDACFVYYTASKSGKRVGRVSRFRVTGGRPDAESEEVVIEVEQPWANHNGGQIAFGPDGHLYVGLGDGGAAGDPLGNGQDRSSLLGAILRISVSSLPYAIPLDNPFAGRTEDWRQEIYAYGLRNPWRFSFDQETNRLWVGDVGQNRYEEIDVVKKGGNYGWDCREGNHPFEPPSERSPGCEGLESYEPAVWEYGRSEGMSVTGGFVYRGSRLKDLVGWYVYADYVTGRIWALSIDGENVSNRLLVDTDLMISSFGLDGDGELLICDHDASGGETAIYRLVQGP